MTNTALLRQIIADHDMSVEKAGILADLSSSGIRKKMSGISPWLVKDIVRLTPVLNLTHEQIINAWFC
jgi:hypothetical protein